MQICQLKTLFFFYELVFRIALVKYGLWNKLRLDHGLEFALCIFVKETLKVYHRSQEKDPWRQTALTQNNVIERFWPDMNSRVNYPIRRAFVQILEINNYDLSDPVLKYCFYWLSIYIVEDAEQHLIDSWNYRRVPGRNGCIPIENMRHTKRIA